MIDCFGWLFNFEENIDLNLRFDRLIENYFLNLGKTNFIYRKPLTIEYKRIIFVYMYPVKERSTCMKKHSLI